MATTSQPTQITEYYACASEFQPKNQLHLPGCFVEGGNGGESRLAALAAILRHAKIILTDQRLWVVEIGVIEEVEGVRAEGEPAGFAQPTQRERAAQGNIHVVQTRSAERVPSAVALPAGGRLGEGLGVERVLGAGYGD